MSLEIEEIARSNQEMRESDDENALHQNGSVKNYFGCLATGLWGKISPILVLYMQLSSVSFYVS